GAGLGLALLYSLVQLAGGRLRLEGTPGRGSAVRIFLPIADGAEDPEALRVGWPSPGEGHVDVGVDETGHPPNETDDRGVAVGSRRLAHVVVVEDEPAVRSLVERVLRRAGYDVAAFRDGDAALDALADRSVPVDLLLTDVVMPGPNGFEVARRLRETRPDVPVVVMSGHASDEVRAGGGSVGVAAALTKPFTVPDLLDQVGAALAAKARAGRRDSPA
ncbi:MAG TPA: response regulator, partial [Candidatus Limnocylindrales bacterium]|nr:response regulator [Candidatus Limnocylindrales bacterium]